ncbi:hypothetical protein JL108_14615 [Aeromicrobium sp. YIM 150415]|uniref:hypothetical protein n=1 Tax=Aeromicrobium sp. YIM 150415 TaxID=2803912 RepID=UPI0019632496|nr:hypothetical protein [Aeromicrobium sp. YIM 150415]MBM9464687.1 hypothetical protein [Aeromicrobium sp. YIM 150415]
MALTAAALVALATDTVRGVGELSSDHLRQSELHTTHLHAPSIDVQVPSITPPSIEIPDLSR